MPALILVSDADPFNLRLLQELCEAGGHRVITCGEGGEVLDVVARKRPDLILLDQATPEIDGFEVLRIMKSDDVLARIPVLLVTATGDVKAQRRAIELGAEDYLTKPYLVFEVQQRVRNALRAVRGEHDVDEGDSIGTAHQLGIGLEYEFTRAVRYHHSLGCIVLRVGNHAALTEQHGERWRRAMGHALRACVRATDQVYLSGGDEFVLLLPETDDPGTRIVLDRLTTHFAEATPELPSAPTLRGGLAVYPVVPVEDGLALLSSARNAFDGE
ncbi:MAG: response regulator [Myxococcota bacterium]